MHMLTKPQVLYDENHKTALGYKNPFYLCKAQRIQPALYDGTILAKKYDMISVIDSEDTLIQAKDSRSKMIEKQDDPICKEKKKQAFWLPISKLVSETHVGQPVLVKSCVPRELPTKSLVNNSFQKLKSHLDNFDKVVKVRTKDFEKGLHTEINEMKSILKQMESEVEQYLVHTAVNSYAVIVNYQSMEKSYTEEYNRNLTLEAELSKMNKLSTTCSRLENHCIFLELKIQQNKESFQNNRSCNNPDAPAFKEFFVINDLKAQLKANESSISKMRAHIETLKGESVSDNNVSINNANVIARGMFRVDLEPLSLKLKKNIEARVYYLQETKEHANSLHRIVEQARALNLIDDHLDYACKFTTRIKELLVYVNETCPSSQVKSKKLVAVTPMNRNRKVRFQEPKQSTSNTPTQVSKSNKKKDWKPTGKVFTSVGYRWLPTGWTFTIDGTKCPMTRITSTKVVPPKETSQTSLITQNLEIKVYSSQQETQSNKICRPNLPLVFSTWMAFGGNTRDLGSFREETDKITDLHQIHEEVLFTEREDGVPSIKRRHRNLSSDGIIDLATASGRG
ncbi:hypothetical protein Tco_0408206 [Tanacetum coccineum]